MSKSSIVVRTVRALRIALFGIPHRHRWQIMHRIRVVNSKDQPVATDYEMQCCGCGDIQKRRV